MHDVGNSPAGILSGFMDVLPTVVADYKIIISSLTDDIGHDASTVIAAIDDLESSLNQIMDDYQIVALLNACDEENIDYTPVLESIQNLTNSVASVVKEVLNNSSNDGDVGDSLYIMGLILHHLLIIADATVVSIAVELFNSCGSIPTILSQSLKVIDSLLSGITKALNAVVDSVMTVLNVIIVLAESLNAILEEVFGLVQDVTKTVSTVTQSLTNIL